MITTDKLRDLIVGEIDKIRHDEMSVEDLVQTMIAVITQNNKDWAEQCAEVGKHDEWQTEIIKESRIALEKCIKSFTFQGVNCGELKKLCYMIDFKKTKSEMVDKLFEDGKKEFGTNEKQVDV